MLSSFSRAIISSLAVMSATTQVVAAEIGANATTKVSDNSWIDMDTQAEATLPLGDQVGSGDKVKVTFVGNTDLTGEFRVQGDGTITLPVLGAFSVAGMTSGDIAKLITARFSQDARRSPNNQVVVDVTEWRPIFVTGGVSKPGAYTFMPGMTVLHAISQSGGLYRIADGDISTFINVAQNVSRMEEVLQRLKFSLVRVASLSAEREGQAEMKAAKLLLYIAGADGI
jgi:protein involved in polysaccharide export with SLBB domain